MKAVNSDLVKLGNVSKVAQKYQLPYDSVYRHYREHLAVAALSAGSSSLKLHGENLLQDMTDIMDTSREILESAQADGHRGLSLKAVKEIRNNVETLGKLLYSIKQQEAQGLAPDEVEEFHRWKEDKDTINLDIFSQEDRELIREVCVQKLIKMDSFVEQEAFRSNSYIMQEFGPAVDQDLTEQEKGKKYPLVRSQREPDDPDGEPEMRRTNFN